MRNLHTIQAPHQAYVVTETFGECYFERMINQPAIAYCFGFTIYEPFRGQGHGHQLKRMQEEAMTSLGIRIAFCSVKTGNHAQQAILTKAGWHRGSWPMCGHHGKEIEIWMRRIQPSRKIAPATANWPCGSMGEEA